MSLQSQIDRFIDACDTGDLLLVQELLNDAVDLDASRSTSQIVHAQEDRALRWAAIRGHEAICRLLIEHGADIRVRNDYALQWAAENGHEAVCRLLIRHGADIHAQDDGALRWAAKNGHEAVCRLLIEGVDPFATTPRANIHVNGDQALRWAAYGGHEAVCRILIEHGANIHAQDDYALRWAARNGHEAVCRLLLEGSDASDPDPLMAKHISPEYSKEVLRVFQAYGDHDAISEALMGFTDDQNDYIASCFISRKSAV